MQHMTGMTEAQTHKAVSAVQDVAERAGTYVQQQAGHLAERASDVAHEVNERLKEYTGRPLGAWATEIREFVRQHPFQALAATIALGYVLGKALKR